MAARGAGEGFDLALQPLPQAERERRFGHEEERADEETHQVVDEGRLLAFEAVADELGDETDGQAAEAEGQPHGRGQ